MKDGEVVRKLAKAGWKEIKKQGKGSHTKMRHPDHANKITIPKGEIKKGTLISIENDSGVNLRRKGGG